MALDKINAAEIRASLVAEFAHELMTQELKTWQMRIARLATPLQRYANSTTNRSMTARLLCIAAFDAAKDATYLGVTKQECAEALGVSLNAATAIVSHYVGEGWAVAHESSSKHFQSGRELRQSTDDYANRTYELSTSYLWSAHQKLIDFDQITTSHLHLRDDSKSE
jgi:hypothetical protein